MKFWIVINTSKLNYKAVFKFVGGFFFFVFFFGPEIFIHVEHKLYILSFYTNRKW